MDRLPSSQFRKTYASLERPVDVTANGHVIGRWTPVPPFMREALTEAQDRIARTFGVEGVDLRVEYDTTSSFNSRPFTPVPKRGK